MRGINPLNPVSSADLQVITTDSAASVLTKSIPSHTVKPGKYLYSIESVSVPSSRFTVITIERKILTKVSSTQNEAGERPRKKKKIKDEIDDIFGF